MAQEYLIQEESLIDIADKVRTLSGTENQMSLKAIENHVDEANTNISIEADLIEQINAALINKMAPSDNEIQYPTLTNPASADDVAENKQFIDSNGNIVTGTITDAMFSSISDTQVTGGDDSAYKVKLSKNNSNLNISYTFDQNTIHRNGRSISINTPISRLGTAKPEEVQAGKVFSSSNGLRLVGTHECEKGLDTSDATATAADLAANKTAYVNGKKISGSVEVVDSDNPGLSGSFNHEFNSGNILNYYTVDKDQLVRSGTKLSVGAIWDYELGDARPEDVAAGKTFTSVYGQKIAGTGSIAGGGTLSITENGTYNVTNYASVNVNVASTGNSLPEGAVAVQKVLAAQASQQIGSGYSLSVTYGDNVEINDSIALAFTGTTKTLSGISATTDFSVLLGKYVRTGSSFGSTTGTFYYIPDDATFTVGGQSMSKTLTCDKAQKVSMEKVSM